MILVFPLALSDKARIKKFVEGIKAFGPYNKDRALIIPSPSCMVDEDMRLPILELADVFGGTGQKGRSTIRQLPNDPEGGWPRAANIHFQFCVEYVAALQPQEPWMIIESDCTPTRRDWTTLLASEYAIMGNPFMGAVEPSRKIEHYPDGSQRQVIEGEHMVGGCGIYPPNYTRGTGKGGSPRVIWDFPDDRIPYDIRCQYDHWPVSPSKVMLHMPRTVNWRPIEGEPMHFSCEDEAGEPDEFGNSWAKDNVDLSGVYFVHGCKDSSLIELLLENVPVTNYADDFHGPMPQTTSEPDAIPANQPSAERSSLDLALGDILMIKSRWINSNPDLDEGIFWDEFSSELKALENRMFPANETTKPQSTEKPAKSIKMAKIKIGEYAKIITSIQSSQKGRLTMEQLSDQTGIPLNKLKDMIKAPESPAKIVAFGHVKLRELKV